jgi:hypothetical protein
LSADIDVLEAMKCLNMFGILWSGRGQMKKSLLYLLAAKHLYHSTMSNQQSTASGMSSASKLTASNLKVLESMYTHNLFYLAQAYGHIAELKLSCIYCQETLRRQYAQGFASSSRSAYEWSKNCMNISDFYQSMGYFHRAHLSLAAAKLVLKKYIVLENLPDSERDDLIELEADIHRRQAKIDEALLQKCYERESLRLANPGVDESEINAEFHRYEVEEASFEQELLDSINPNPSIVSTTTAIPASSFIPGLTELPEIAYTRVSQIRTFEDARQVFLRGASCVEAAKKHYLLDGMLSYSYILGLPDESN